jgi:glycosyltransferase involved in cell wall biosynthesis
MDFLGAFAEVVGEGGLTFHTDEVADLVAKLVQLFNNPALAEQLSVSARQRILDVFSQERMLEDHLCLYDDLIRPIPR